MKIMASIPVEKVTGNGWTQFREELREVEVIRVIRYPATRRPELNRWRYQADIADHPDMHPEASRFGAGEHMRVNIRRRWINPKWKPPEFAPGKLVFEVQQGSEL